MNKVEGVGEVIKALEAIGESIKTPELQTILRAEGQRVIETAKSLVPVETGDLRDSIGYITSKDGQNLDKVLIGARKNFYNSYLAPMIEHGTEPRIVKSGAYRGLLKPKPFLRPALDLNKNAVVNGVNNGISKLVTNLAKKNKLI